VARLSFYPVGDSYLLVAVVAIALVGLLAIGPARHRLSRRRRAALFALRLGSVLMVLLAMLRPTLVTTEVNKQAATLIVLADTSRSMSVPDAVGGRKTRYEAMRGSLDDARDGFRRIAKNFEVKVFAFDLQARPLDLADGEIPLPEQPDGRQTAIGSVLEDVLQQAAGKRLLGVILLSDGAQRAYAPRDAAPQTAAAEMKRLGCPLYTVPLGQDRGLGQAKDVAVKELLVDDNVFVKNQLAIGGQIRVDGFVNREIPVRVLFETSPGKMEVVAQQVLKPTADGQLLSVDLGYVPEVPGQYKLTLEVPDEPGELVTTNNRLSTFVNVLAGGLNVLYLEGFPPRVDTRFLRRALDASADISVDYLTLAPGARPADLAERFKPGKYAVYVIGDVDSTAFKPEELKDLAEAVSRGAGLVMLGGFHTFGAGGYAGTPLADVLPIRMSRFERQKPGDPDRPDLHLPGPLRMRPSRFGMSHFALMLSGDRQKNLELWDRLPPLDGANRFGELKPGAVPLAVDDRDDPLLVSQSFGGGRVMAFAGDSTWRWWLGDFEQAHKRFWRQMILWLARKDDVVEGNVWVRLAKRRIAPGTPLEFTVGAQSPTGDPVGGVKYEAEVTLPDGGARPIRLTRRGETWTGVVDETRGAGDYAVSVKASKDEQLLGAARARFLVFEEDLELDNASADVTGLESLAAMTGGESIAAEQLPELLQKLLENTATLEDRVETKRTYWDRWPFFLLLVGLLGAEWYLRKRWGLV
jgi:hypothetical protein